MHTSTTRRPPPDARRRRAFTLIELLVVVSIISLLIGILLPSLGGALKEAKSMSCAAMQRGLVQNILGWSNSSQDAIPGINTTGLALSNTRPGDAVQFASRLGTSPTQPFDWISPVIGDDLGAQRVDRFWSIMRDYRCPVQNLQVPLFGGASDPGVQEAIQYVNNGAEQPFAPSYLMPVVWQYGGHRDNVETGNLGEERILSHAYPSSYRQTASPPASYNPMLSRIGEPAMKLAHADGFRYLNAGVGNTDVDVSVLPSQFGAFTSSGGVFRQERSYGSQYDLPRKRNIALTYRHKAKINVAFWDGHISALTERDSRDPKLWYPSGSRLGAAGSIEPESLNFGIRPNELIP